MQNTNPLLEKKAINNGEKQKPSSPDASGNRRKPPQGMLMTLLLAAALCLVGFFFDRLGLLQGAAASNAQTSTQAGLTGVDAALYLKAQAWETKSHDKLKSLSKIDNLRIALDFFQRYAPAQIAAVPSMPERLEQAITDFSGIAGKMISMQASIGQKYSVTEKIALSSNAPSALLSLDAAGEKGIASLLVVGSALDGLKQGDAIDCRCIPIYCYTPKEGNGQKGLFLITIPELVKTH
jgi:hypothetical protein